MLIGIYKKSFLYIIANNTDKLDLFLTNKQKSDFHNHLF
mgnify:CR=1 FL=1|jgi:hypothetical protein